MSKELDKALDNLQWTDPYYADAKDEIIFEYGWNAARDKILEILKENIQTYDSGRGPNFDWRFIDENVIKQIEKL